MTKRILLTDLHVIAYSGLGQNEQGGSFGADRRSFVQWLARFHHLVLHSLPYPRAFRSSVLLATDGGVATT